MPNNIIYTIVDDQTRVICGSLPKIQLSNSTKNQKQLMFTAKAMRLKMLNSLKQQLTCFIQAKYVLVPNRVSTHLIHQK